MPVELRVYCDESDSSGDYFSNFYGRALVRSSDLDRVISGIRRCMEDENLHREVKWQRVTSQYLPKYQALMDTFFSMVREDLVKMRVMFTHNYYEPRRLSTYHREHQYFLLYYQFIKHAFGFRYINCDYPATRLRLYFDKLPDKREKCELFKDYIAGLNRSREFREARVSVDRSQMVEIDSSRHEIVQCLDVVLGAIQFRLNEKHKNKPPGASRRGKRTIAKERLYKHINRHLQSLYPNFNIGISTGKEGDRRNLWRHRYRHWKFLPRERRVRTEYTKGKK